MPKAPLVPEPPAHQRSISKGGCWRGHCRWRSFGRCWIRWLVPKRERPKGKPYLPSFPTFPSPLSQRQKNVVERVGPGRDSEPAQDIESAEEETRYRPESERADGESVSVGAHIVEGRKHHRPDQDPKDGRAAPRPAETSLPD